MTPRYAYMKPRPKAYDYGYSDSRETMDVTLTEEAPVDTGLVDQFGVPIVRLPDKRRVGF